MINSRLSIGTIFLVSSLALAAGQCKPETECCTPGMPQYGDDQFETTMASFCTDKAFEKAYKLKIGANAPLQLNFVDYCTDEVIYSAYFTVEIDKFSVVNIPCTYDPAPCALLPAEQQASCLEGQKLWTQHFGCANGTSFYNTVMEKRICKSSNYPVWGHKLGENDTEPKLWYIPEEPAVSTEPYRKGYCNCNYKDAMAKANVSNITDLDVGVPNGFIKDGMATFYVQLVIGGRTTSDPEVNCECKGPGDTSKECMCMLGTKKVPYIYNNAFVPYYTALISMRSGELVFQGTYIMFNFDANEMGCAGCPADNCWAVPKLGLEHWLQTGIDLSYEAGMACAIRSRPDQAAVPFCQYPASNQSISLCTLKFYIAWVGTDGLGAAAGSNNEMFSRFTQMGVANVAWQLYSGASNLVTDVTSRITGGRRLFG